MVNPQTVEPVRRPGAVIAVAVINLLYGLGAITGAAFMLAVMPSLLRDLALLSPITEPTSSPDAIRMEESMRDLSHTMLALALPLGIAAALFGCVVIVASVGLLRMRAWARSVTLGIAWVLIAFVAVTDVVLLVQHRWDKALELSSVMYWALVIVLMMSGDVKRAFERASIARAARAPGLETAPGAPAVGIAP